MNQVVTFHHQVTETSNASKATTLWSTPPLQSHLPRFSIANNMRGKLPYYFVQGPFYWVARVHLVAFISNLSYGALTTPECLAEMVGFEPTSPFTWAATLPTQCLQPLGHISNLIVIVWFVKIRFTVLHSIPKFIANIAVTTLSQIEWAAVPCISI